MPKNQSQVTLFEQMKLPTVEGKSISEQVQAYRLFTGQLFALVKDIVQERDMLIQFIKTNERLSNIANQAVEIENLKLEQSNIVSRLKKLEAFVASIEVQE